jgi:hypothetical protein
MLSISLKRLIKQRKVQIIAAATVLVILIGSITAFILVQNNLNKKKPVTTVKTVKKKIVKPTASTEDVQSDLNLIKAKSSSLDAEIDGASNGLSDQQTNLTY